MFDKVHIREVAVVGEIAAGNVVPLIPRGNKKIHIPVKERHYNVQLDSYEVRGESLSGLNITDGCYLTFRPCNFYEVKPGKVYIVYIVSTGELIARCVKLNGDTITLQGANPDYPDRTFEPEEIEIRGLVLYCTFDLS